MRNTFLIVILLVLGNQVLGQTKNFIDLPYMEVTGTAELKIIPNEISIDITLNESDTKGKVSIESLEKDLLKILKSLEIDTKKDLKLKDYSSNFRFYKLKKDDIHKSKEYELLLYDSKKIGALFYKLEQAGISNTNISNLDHSELESFKLQVKTNAIKAAKEKASALANAIGQEIGKAIYVQEYEQFNNFREANSMIKIRGVSSIDTNDLPAIEFENITLKAQMLCRFELK